MKWTMRDKVADGTRKVELVAVQPPPERAPEEEGELFGNATVFVPERAADYFSNKVEAYRDQDRVDRQGNPTGPRNEALVARVVDVQAGSARTLFTDDIDSFPGNGEAIWWEVWCRSGHKDLVNSVAHKLGLDARPRTLSFPEREVVLIHGNPVQIDRLIWHVDGVAELRRAQDTPAMFVDLLPYDQAEWVNDLADRLVPAPPQAPYVSILDSGATQGHPLIAQHLDVADQFAVEHAWGVNDSPAWNGHGTAMAGGVLYPDLNVDLANSEEVSIEHRLETVKVLPHDGDLNEPRLYGAMTEAGVAEVENAEPNRQRVFCMAVTSEYGAHRGRPSSWSAAIDQLAFAGPEGGRLIVLAAGNISDDIMAADYPDRNDLEPVQSPSQAWNALVVGGFTLLDTLIDPVFNGWEPIAPVGELAPVSRTSVSWDRQWPVRPDVVLEAGNLAHDGANPADRPADLQLVTAYYRPQMQLLESFGDTSAAAAQAASLCARLRASYPALRPETIRGLVIHSAEWTASMRTAIDAARTQNDKINLMRRFGWGVPDVQRALRSAANDATVIVEGDLIPFERTKSTARLHELHLHELPWPREQLEALADLPVDLRVTLSYFIEPNPAERGWTRRHRYSSHGLRFKLKRPLETVDQFHLRINQAADVEDDVGDGPDDNDGWTLGERARDKGSVHSDHWRGPAAELAQRHTIAVVPVTGWWKEKPALGRCDTPVRYSLIVSIRAEEAEVDIYTEIANQIAVQILVG